jgi:hypothetical protein
VKPSEKRKGVMRRHGSAAAALEESGSANAAGDSRCVCTRAVTSTEAAQTSAVIEGGVIWEISPVLVQATG